VRIIGGSARGRRLQSVAGQATRPTADRVRQSLFDLLGQRCDDLRVLDLYAGTGALALEALSRGATSAVLVEQDAKAVAVIEANLAALGFAERARLLREEVSRALPRLAKEGSRFELIFSDPPYALLAAQATVDAIARHGLLAPGGRIVLERGRREPAPREPEGFALHTEREYGEAVVRVVSTPLAPFAPLAPFP
jgi:16S rRNA (guanine(966)-N(2))-methyltransferase RsmD